jgi:hypothetical protein
LIALYERQLDQKGASAPDLHVRIAVVARERMDDVDRAFDEIDAALRSDGQHGGAIGELEALLRHGKDPQHRARAAEMLEPVYQKRGNFTELMSTIGARLESTQDPKSAAGSSSGWPISRKSRRKTTAARWRRSPSSSTKTSPTRRLGRAWNGWPRSPAARGAWPRFTPASSTA